MLILASAPGSWDWLLGLAGPVLVSQFVLALIGLGSLLILTRRFLATDFPAFKNEIKGQLDTLHRDLEKLRSDLQARSDDLLRLEERHDSLRGRVDRMENREARSLDDSRADGAPRRPRG
jgi:hypothetical protein